MHFDDRLATVLRHRAAGERAARTQFRQLLDLLGSRRHGRDESILAAGWLRLAALGESIPAAERAEMIREPSSRFRNPELAFHLAEDEPEVAAAALAVAQMSAEDWEALIPRLPIRARGFLRLRRDLPESTRQVLDRLGVRDRGLPPPASVPAESEPAQPAAAVPLRPVPANDLAGDESEIGALVKRIEAFRKTREGRPAGEESPRLPLGERAEAARTQLNGFAFTTDSEGRIDWADGAAAPMVVGAILPPAAQAARTRHEPLRGITIDWQAAPQVSGTWVIDAAPRFSDQGGRFLGFGGRFRRPGEAAIETAAADPAADRMRQLLHELKNPINAIQGYAEMIQQQLFGPAPHEYRALAAAIAGDAARILAGFDELDRLARLETGALSLETGETDLARIVAGLARQLDQALAARGSGFDLDAGNGPCTVPLRAADAESMAWRLLAAAAGSAHANERLKLALTTANGTARLACALPVSLAAHDDPFAADSRGASGAISAGMFGAGFALRLARAEARGAGGSLVREGNDLALTLPCLTAAAPEPSPIVADAAAHG